MGALTAPFRKLLNFGRQKDIGNYAYFPSLPMNFWQLGYNLPKDGLDKFNAVYACVSVLAQEVARLHIDVYRVDTNGAREEIRGSAAYRVMRWPNEFQTRSDFWLQMMHSLLLDGNAYAYATRNQRSEVDSLTPINPRHVQPYVAPDGQIFYRFAEGGWASMDAPVKIEEMVPARNVMHLRLFTPTHALVGESPLTACYASAATGMAINSSTQHFFANKQNPSGLIRIPGKLSKPEATKIVDGWMERYSGQGSGRPAVLSNDASWQQLTMSAVDAELIATYKLQIEDVARVYRVPMFMLGSTDMTYANAETMARTFYSSGFSFYLEHIEANLDKFFRLPANEYIEFDIEQGLLRADTKDRMEALTRGVQGGVLSPDEARRKEKLPPTPGGDKPFLQQQMQPVDQRAQNLPLGVGAGGEEVPNNQPPEEPDDVVEESAVNIVNRVLSEMGISHVE